VRFVVGVQTGGVLLRRTVATPTGSCHTDDRRVVRDAA
jgi:hypothetical protein